MARRASPSASTFTSAGAAHSPSGAPIGLVHHHALGEQAGERLRPSPTWPVAFMARVKKRLYSRCKIACSMPPIY